MCRDWLLENKYKQVGFNIEVMKAEPSLENPRKLAENLKLLVVCKITLSIMHAFANDGQRCPRNPGRGHTDARHCVKLH